MGQEPEPLVGVLAGLGVGGLAEVDLEHQLAIHLHRLVGLEHPVDDPIRESTPDHPSVVGVVDRLRRPFGIADVAAPGLRLNEQSRAGTTEQGVVEERPIEDPVLSRHAIQVLGVPPERFENGLDKEHLGVRLVHRATLRSTEDLADRPLQRRHRVEA